MEQDSYEKVDTLEQLQKQLEDTRSINLRLFEEIREKNEKEKVRVKKLEESHNVSIIKNVVIFESSVIFELGNYITTIFFVPTDISVENFTAI